jgi:hypothetical protein
MLNFCNYLLLDAAKMENSISDAFQLNPAYVSLYKGESEADLKMVAPYLFTFDYNSIFANWYLNKGLYNSWGVLLKSDFSIEVLQKHFRKFLMVSIENIGEHYFRFYDPRVLRIFLPTCSPDQIFELFQTIDYYMIEDNINQTINRFSQNNGILNIANLVKEEIKIPTYRTDEIDALINNETDGDGLTKEELQLISQIDPAMAENLQLNQMLNPNSLSIVPNSTNNKIDHPNNDKMGTPALDNPDTTPKRNLTDNGELKNEDGWGF